MFEGFFHTLRAYGVPVAIDEWLALQDALGRGLADSSLTRFHGLARALLVKNERHFDDYDLAFADYFGGVEQADDAIADRVWQWLDAHPEALQLTDAQRAQIDRALSRLDLDELRRRLQERLANQTEAHHGGDRHIGTGGTSPFGHSGWHPGGIRIGGQSRHRTAAQVAGERRFREYRTDSTLGVREMGLALRRLRRLTTRLEGPATELDLDASIAATADHGGQLRLVFRRPRRNQVRVLLLLDVGGSMDEHASLADRLFSAVHQTGRFRELTVRYFHNC
ncbi:MAG TPA: VWA domain-containing protein, partial [Miltoncostaeaceae bacterium]|nr:VWA domain-containing protein [Miltoncostaeaceae bacterium]